jgi:hypothetical protein
VAGKSGTAHVYVIDVSVNGLRLAHQGTIPPPGQSCGVEFDWEGAPIALQCTVIHNSLFKLARSAAEKSVYHAGVEITEASAESRAALRTMVSDCVARVLDEQKANARGIPAEAAQMFQTGKATEYVRCELIDGAWRRTTTTLPDQPANGFTVSAAEEHDQIEMLCATFASSDSEGRKLIQTMAEMSISSTEGVPTRRYTT